MDIAFPALFLFLVVAPGFIFREFNQRRDVRAAEATPLSRATFSALLAALAINSMVCWCAHLVDHDVQWWVVYSLIVQSDSPDPEFVSRWRLLLDHHAYLPAAYFALTHGLAFLVAKGWIMAVEHFGLERNSHCLSRFARGDAPWLYLLEGLDHDSPVDSVWAAATVDLGDGVYLYQGLLADFELADDGKLDRIVLTQASRRTIDADRQQDQANTLRFYDIRGDRLVLQYDRVTSLNILYVTL